MTTGTALSDVWSLIIPNFGAILSGDVEMITPILVLVIWGIALWTAIFAFRQARKAMRTIAESERLFDRVPKGEVGAYRNEIGRRAKESSATVQEAWREFDETLVAEKDKVFNTVTAEEFFNEHRFAPRLVGNRFLHAVPTALTTIGLLGTFLGLTIGLRGLDLGSTTDELRTGIQILVDGAALGFTASLWGVFMSLITNVFERWQERRVITRTRRLQAHIDELFPMRSPEQSLSAIAAHTDESRQALQVLHEKIGSALQESVKHVGENTSRAISEAIQGSLAPVMEQLAQKAADQSAEVFQQISGELTETFRAAGADVADELARSAEAMRQSVEYMGDQLAKQSDQHLAQMNTMQVSAARYLDDLRTTTTTQLQAITNATDRQIALLDESLPRVVEGLDKAATLVGSATSGMDAAVAGFARVTAELSETSATLSRMLAEGIAAMGELSDKTSSAASALSAQQASVADLTDRAVAAAELLRATSAAMQGGFEGMRSAQDRFLADLEQRLGNHSEAMAGWLATYANEVSKQTQHRMGEWNAQTEQFTSTMLNATQALSDVVDELSARQLTDTAGAPA